MKEVKYRVWDKVNCEWLEYKCKNMGWKAPPFNGWKLPPVPRSLIPEKIWVYQSPSGWDYYELQWCLDHPEAFGVVQYTGLKDKNDRELYEGDAIIDRNNTVWIISFNAGQFIATRMDGVDCDSLYSVVDKEVKFIGSIYENQDLLTEEREKHWKLRMEEGINWKGAWE